MATIRKRNRKWHVQIRRKDHPTLTRSFDMRKHARAWAREEESKLDRIQAWQSPVSMHRLTLGDIVRRYRDEEVPKKRGADVETTILNAFLRSELVNNKLSEIEPAHFAAWRDKRLQHVRPATICRELGIYQHMFGVAIKEWGLPLATNPLAEVRKPKRDDRTPHRIPDSMVLQLEEAAMKGRTPLIIPLLRFALETAMRRGDLLALQWSYINLERQLLHIPKTKNGCPRTIPLTPAATAILLSLGRTKETSFVFPITRSALAQCWRRLCRRAELKDVRFHDLRHEAISRFFELGLSLPEVALISGHKDHRMLMHYTHLRPELIVLKLNATEPRDHY
ncbi:MAG: site-specific integrase [Alphaproteobacteria bacterium]